MTGTESDTSRGLLSACCQLCLLGKEDQTSTDSCHSVDILSPFIEINEAGIRFNS